MAAVWKIINMDRHTSKSGKSDVVFQIHWECQDSEIVGAETFIGFDRGHVAVQTDTLGDNFVAYGDITPDKALEWVFANLPDRTKDEIEAGLQAQIEADKAPVMKSGLPF